MSVVVVVVVVVAVVVVGGVVVVVVEVVAVSICSFCAELYCYQQTYAQRTTNLGAQKQVRREINHTPNEQIFIYNYCFFLPIVVAKCSSVANN